MLNALVPHKISLPKAQRTLSAAQYVRMSTDHQQYSIENQAAVIAAYAQARGLEIVRTYRDDGESGLAIKNRPGLIGLIADVCQGRANFDHILIYDVSRWGRFQDTDESAHYEFVCRQAGVTVSYCAESGRSKGVLEAGQWKSLQTDRIILRPGPQHEIETVRRIFDRFVNGHRTETKIARELNLCGVFNRDRPWTCGKIHYLLQNDNCIGTNRYNRHSAKLRTARKENAPADWIKKEGVFEPIVDKEIFAKAQQVLRDRQHCRGMSDEEMLKRLRVLLHRRGRLSRDVINETEGVPGSTAYLARFGSLSKAYRLIGYTPKRNYEHIKSRPVRCDMIKTTVMKVGAALAASGRDVRVDQVRQILRVHVIAISFRVARSRNARGATHPSWVIVRGRHLPSGLVVVIRLSDGNREIMDYLIMPASRLVGRDLRFSERNHESFGLRRYGTMAGLIETIKRRVSNLAYLTKRTPTDRDEQPGSSS